MICGAHRLRISDLPPHPRQRGRHYLIGIQVSARAPQRIDGGTPRLASCGKTTRKLGGRTPLQAADVTTDRGGTCLRDGWVVGVLDPAAGG
jgi:hypothetical protein